MRRKPFENAAVAAVFDAYPRDVRASLLELRQPVFDTASGTNGVGTLEETLRWDEPSCIALALTYQFDRSARAKAERGR